MFAAGAGGKGGKERTKKVDEEGAIKVSLLYESNRLLKLTQFAFALRYLMRLRRLQVRSLS